MAIYTYGSGSAIIQQIVLAMVQLVKETLLLSHKVTSRR